MKYFTPDLLERFGSLDDDVADALQAEWDHVSDKYRDYLARIRPTLPPSVSGPAFRDMLDRYPLHDACIIRRQSEWGGRTYTMELVPVSHGGRPLVLTYSLASDSEAPTNLPPFTAPSEQCFWLYDEVEGPDANTGVFTHTILFSDKTEVCLHFTDFNLGSPACNQDDDSALSRQGYARSTSSTGGGVAEFRAQLRLGVIPDTVGGVTRQARYISGFLHRQGCVSNAAPPAGRIRHLRPPTASTLPQLRANRRWATFLSVLWPGFVSGINLLTCF